MKSKGKPMGQAAEKREFDRFDFQKPVLIYPVSPSKSGNILEVESRSLEAKAHNISEGGLKLVTPQSFPENSILKLNFKVKKDQTVEVYGKIMWSEQKSCGVRFVLADPEARQGIRAIGQKKPKAK